MMGEPCAVCGRESTAVCHCDFNPPAEWLRAKANSYNRDAEIIAADGMKTEAMSMTFVADELRKCADQLEAK